MVVLGVDAHKRTHTIVAVDSNGAQLGQLTVPATSSGHIKALKWASQWDERKWAVEDCRALSRLFEADLLRAGEQGMRVAPKLMALHRRTVRVSGKSDPIDALAVALVVLREADLPVICLDGPERELRLLTDHRESVVGERTRLQNRLHLLIHELEPEHEIVSGSLDRLCVLNDLSARVADRDSVVSEIATELIDRCMQLTKQAKDLEKRIAKLVTPLAPSLLELRGCGALGAAKIIGEIGTISRFKSQDAFARHNGTAPIPVWSANTEHFRLNRGGNRQINAVIHRIATTQMRWSDDAKRYVEMKMANGMSKSKAKRALKRQISNQVYKRLLADERARAASSTPQIKLVQAA